MLKDTIRTIPDYPKPGIQFRDITTLFRDATAFRAAVESLSAPYRNHGVGSVVGIEARGFILGGAVAHQLGTAFVPIRKKDKLPHETLRIEYTLEYGRDVMEIHRDALRQGEKVILVDDLIATGGSALAAISLLRSLGADIVAACFVIDLPALKGADRVRALDIPVQTLVTFDGH